MPQQRQSGDPTLPGLDPASAGKPPAGRSRVTVGGDESGHPQDPGLVCLECRTELVYKGRGRRPQYCSATCRHRAWERRRAAADGVVASRVVELPALPTVGYDREGVARWLARDPERFAAVLSVMARTRALGGAGTVVELGRALDRVRDTGGLSQVPGTRLEKQLTDRCTELDEENRRLRSIEQDTERTRELVDETHRLRARLNSTGGAISSPTPEGGLAPRQAGTPVPPAGHKVVEVAGRTFHVPVSWSRQQYRKWCREHPDRAVE